VAVREISVKECVTAPELITVCEVIGCVINFEIVWYPPPRTERSSGTRALGTGHMGMFGRLGVVSAVCGVPVSPGPDSRSHLRIPSSAGLAQHVPVAVVKPRDMP